MRTMEWLKSFAGRFTSLHNVQVPQDYAGTIISYHELLQGLYEIIWTLHQEYERVFFYSIGKGYQNNKYQYLTVKDNGELEVLVPQPFGRLNEIHYAYHYSHYPELKNATKYFEAMQMRSAVELMQSLMRQVQPYRTFIRKGVIAGNLSARIKKWFYRELGLSVEVIPELNDRIARFTKDLKGLSLGNAKQFFRVYNGFWWGSNDFGQDGSCIFQPVSYPEYAGNRIGPEAEPDRWCVITTLTEVASGAGYNLAIRSTNQAFLGTSRVVALEFDKIDAVVLTNWYDKNGYLDSSAVARILHTLAAVEGQELFAWEYKKQPLADSFQFYLNNSRRTIITLDKSVAANQKPSYPLTFKNFCIPSRAHLEIERIDEKGVHHVPYRATNSVRATVETPADDPPRHFVVEGEE